MRIHNGKLLFHETITYYSNQYVLGKNARFTFFKYLEWKVSKYGVISRPYFCVFGLNTGKYGPEITLYLDSFHAMSYKIGQNDFDATIHPSSRENIFHAICANYFQMKKSSKSLKDLTLKH